MEYTGTGSGFEDGTTEVHIEPPIFVPAGLSQAEFDEHMDRYEEVMRVIVTQYNARGHWGENMHLDDAWMFELQRDIGAYGDLQQGGGQG
ncbi:Uncharacterised protein [BD1-7 clade bacterium]|uniref:Uncharacterized protein n=1 Tax=BD1-7 clade bacterium TaxID=2029982 RepID=A0A5S9QHQ9_9GAMM|nr:Uncharacterised protein [BD1-7 clade bacterium]CAA0117683.1 Uncharacterised protein [BD1-7 clade bacterium]